MKFWTTAVFVLGMLCELGAQPAYTPQANIGRRKRYLNLGGDVQKVQTLAKENKINEAIREAELTFIFNTEPRYRISQITTWTGEKKSFLDLSNYKMHSVYFRAIGRHLPIFSAQTDSVGKSGFNNTEFSAQSVFSTEKSSALTAGWIFSINEQESDGRGTHALNGYKARQKRIFVELNYGSAVRTDTLAGTRARIHIPNLTVGGQWLYTTAGKLNLQERDRTFMEFGLSVFARTGLIYKDGTAGEDLGEGDYLSVSGGGVRLHFMFDIPAATLNPVGIKTNATVGAYAEAVSLYAAGLEQSPYFVNSGGESVRFYWGFVFNVPFYGSSVKNFNRPKDFETDFSPGTLK